MKSLSNILDIDENVIRSSSYDVGIFASGYESRSRAMCKRFGISRFLNVCVYGFADDANLLARPENDKFFENLTGKEPTEICDGNSADISKALSELSVKHGKIQRVFVDISSMSRDWYGDILNWAKFSASEWPIEIDFVYCGGIYPDNYPSKIISHTAALRGFEGRADIRRKTVAFIGLGFDAITPYSILEDMEPDLRYGFISSGRESSSLERALKVNQRIVEELDGPLATIPHLSFEAAFKTIDGMVAPHLFQRNMVFVAVGPKSHVLAALLVASRYEEVVCLHVRGRSSDPIDVKASEEFAACRTVFE